jgi:hypothetical protein
MSAQPGLKIASAGAAGSCRKGDSARCVSCIEIVILPSLIIVALMLLACCACAAAKRASLQLLSCVFFSVGFGPQQTAVASQLRAAFAHFDAASVMFARCGWSILLDQDG